MNGLSQKLTTFFASRGFWYIVLLFFAFQAWWFVFTANYPMPFDEDFHVGVIDIYAQQWLPFLTTHPEGADQFGAITRDPSYFYHYLMSFPYRLLTAITDNTSTLIATLRIMNVAMFIYGLVLFRRVMLRAKASPAFTHVALAIFTLIPIVPQLAAHINYDNLVMILLPALCLVVFNLVEGFRKHAIVGPALLGFVALSLFISIVKYAVLPFVVAAVVFLLVMFVRSFKGSFASLVPAFKLGLKQTSQPLKVGFIVLIAVGGVLFVQRYGVNLVQYKTPVPDCGKVLTVEQCTAYGPWGRDYYFEHTKAADFNPNPLTYMKEWLYGMWYRTFFAVNGPMTEYTNWRPLIVPSYTALALLLLGGVAVLIWWRQLFRRNAYLIFFGLLIGMYVLILWFDQYGMYRQTAQPVAINGRYLLPILPLLAVILGRSLQLALAWAKKQNLQGILAAVILLCFLHGGGVMTYILRSDSSWYWPNGTAQFMNQTAQKILDPFIVEGRR